MPVRPPELRRVWRALLTLLALLVAGPAATQAPSRPHIVLFIGDDLGWRDLGPYGNRDVRTPSADALAREGLVFNQAFAASPTCTPSRSAMYTGQYPMRNGAHANHSLVDDGVRTLPARLKALGYRVVLAGKTHIGPRELFPFEYLEGSNVMPPGKNHNLWTDLGVQAIDRLLATHDRERPLALVVAAHSPHVYWPENEGYDPAKLTLPGNWVDTPETRLALAQYYTDVTKMDREVGQVRASLARHGYADTLFMLTSDQGAQFPFAKWNLYDAGMRAPLIAAWPGRVKPGTRTEALVSLVDLLPTMLEAAGARDRGGMDGRSFLPVLTGRAATHHAQVFGAHTGDGDFNQAPMRAIRTDQYKLIQNLRPNIRYETHVSRGQGVDGKTYWASWLRRAQTDPRAAVLVRRYHERPALELYDLRADPFEQVNLAADPAHAATLRRLRAGLDRWRLSQGEKLTDAPMPDDARRGEVFYAK